MARLYSIEVEPEVRSWLEGLTDHDFGRVDFLVGMLAERAETLGEPYSRHLGGKVRELRFHLLRRQTRVTYWLASGRRGGPADGLSQVAQRRERGSEACDPGATVVRSLARRRA